jgi:hypothetical protein
MSVSICGFKGTGKESLFYEPSKWLIYSDKPFNGLNFENLTRIASADLVKRECHKYLGLLEDNYEKVKNTLLTPDPITKELKTLREHYINYADEKRIQDSRFLFKNRSQEKLSKDYLMN